MPSNIFVWLQELDRSGNEGTGPWICMSSEGMHRIESVQFLESICIKTISIWEKSLVVTKDKGNIWNVWKARRKISSVREQESLDATQSLGALCAPPCFDQIFCKAVKLLWMGFISMNLIKNEGWFFFCLCWSSGIPHAEDPLRSWVLLTGWAVTEGRFSCYGWSRWCQRALPT